MFHKKLNVSILYPFQWTIKAVGGQQNILLAFRRRGEETEGAGWVSERRFLLIFQDDGFGVVCGVNGGRSLWPCASLQLRDRVWQTCVFAKARPSSIFLVAQRHGFSVHAPGTILPPWTALARPSGGGITR